MGKAKQPEATTDDLKSAGYTVLEQGVPSGRRSVTVWERLNADEEGWDYVISTHDRGRERILNFDKPLTNSPHVVAIGDLMVEAKILRKRPALGYEYALNVNDSNDYEGNFATEELRDRAIDELILSGEISEAKEDYVTKFELEADGTELNDQGASLSSWLKDSRAIAGLQGTAFDLRVAVLIDDQERAEKALGAGADPFKSSANGMTEIHRAAKFGREQILGMMMSLDADVDRRGPGGNTSLHLAAEGDHASVCGMLYAKGASVASVNDAGETPYDISRRSHDTDILRLFSSMRARQAAEAALKEISSSATP